VENLTNLGIGGGNNVGIRVAGKYIALLNTHSERIRIQRTRKISNRTLYGLFKAYRSSAAELAFKE
jgi:hypothetical protein